MTERSKTDIVFMGTPEFSIPTLKALHESESINVVLVITAPDRKQGRSLKLTPCPVKVYAEKNSIPFIQPENVNTEEVANEIREKLPELVVVIAYGQILKDLIIFLPKFATINIHASLLPKFKGASPINAAILAGEKESGATIIHIDAGIDTGRIYCKDKVKSEENETAGSLSKKISQLGAKLLIETIPRIISGELTPQKQSKHGSYAKKLRKQDGVIDWHKEAIEIDRKIRGMAPWPGTFSMLPNGKRLKIIEALPSSESSNKPGKIYDKEGQLFIGCINGSVKIIRLQPEGSRVLNASDFLNGYQQYLDIELT